MAPITGVRLSSLLTHTAELTPRLHFCFRVTISAVLAFATTQFLAIPLHGLWAVLTAVMVTQMSVGGSLKATADYVVGTIGGAVYTPQEPPCLSVQNVPAI